MDAVPQGEQVHVDVEPAFCVDESAPSERRYVFSYTITVHNHSRHSMQLMARHWIITQSSGQVQEVRGKGVVGQQPMIAPGQTFRYTSRAILDGPVGSWRGPSPASTPPPSGPSRCPSRPFGWPGRTRCIEAGA